MSSPALRVALLWHMHQPYYRDLVTGKASLPWARLHAVKDYHPMGEMLKKFPGVHLTINYVPSLIKQIQEYVQDGLRDDFWEVTAVRAADLAAGDRIFILRNFFMTNWNLVVKAQPRYAELLEKRGYNPTNSDLERTAAIFSRQDYLDLQVWFNLAWFHPIHFEADRDLAALVKKGRHFKEDEKDYLLAKQLEILGRVVPLHRELEASGQVELSTSPFYHPILPLLVNIESAREAMPGLELPSPAFARPEDAALQLERALAYHEEVFGRRPAGLWPSEGSVSEEMISLVMDRGFSWMASDEDILYRSLGLGGSGRPVDEEQRCDLLYRPYRMERRGRSLDIIFRDHLISDAIGFTYGHWEPRAAARDLLGRLEGIADRCSKRRREPPLVSIILDGENPWEYYREQGAPFLSEFYAGLERSPRLKGVTVGEGLRESPAEAGIPRLFAGSWINHNFQIWIGHQEDRRAWELLARARMVLDDMKRADGNEDACRKAMEEILIAEGSDWCWWYGEENSSGNDEAFDELYRRHLQNVFGLAGREVPDEYKVTIFTGKRVMVPIIRIYSFINPVIDGRVSSYFEWMAAGEYPIDHQGGTMHRADQVLSAIFFGFNPTTLFIRVDPAMKVMADEIHRYTFGIRLLRPKKIRLEITPRDGEAPLVAARSLEGEERALPAEGVFAAFNDVLEVAVPFDLLGAGVGDRIDFFVTLSRDGRDMGHYPHQGYLSLQVPPSDFEEKIWSL